MYSPKPVSLLSALCSEISWTTFDIILWVLLFFFFSFINLSNQFWTQTNFKHLQQPLARNYLDELCILLVYFVYFQPAISSFSTCTSVEKLWRTALTGCFFHKVLKLHSCFVHSQIHRADYLRVFDLKLSNITDIEIISVLRQGNTSQ